MDTLSINTNPNVPIDHRLAGLGARIASQLLDFLFLFVYYMGMFFLFAWLAGTLKLDSDVLLVLGIAFALPLFFYSFWMELFFQGQSLGKKILKIKVVRLDGTQASIGNYFARWIFRLIDINFFVGSVAITAIALSKQGQRIGDLVAKTTVISLKPQARISDTIHIELPDDHILTFAGVKKLNEKDIYTVREVLTHILKHPEDQQAIVLGYKAKQAIEKKLQLSSDLKPFVFLKVILKDFNYVHKIEDEENPFGANF